MDNFQAGSRLGEVISELAESIGSGQAAVFCGAGISLNSGLPLAGQLVACVLDKLNTPPEERQALLEARLPFEAFIQILGKTTDLAPLLSLFDAGKPNPNHLLLANLVKMGRLTTIVTTNFDCLIEEALNREGLEASRDYRLLYKEQELQEVDWTIDEPRLVKIHGSVHDPVNMAITLEHVASRILLESRRKAIEHIFCSGPHRNVLVLGYSCSDLFDLCPAIENLEGTLKRIFYVHHSDKECVEEVALQEEANPFHRFHGVRLFCDTDLLINALWRSFVAAELPGARVATSWRGSVDQWYSRGCARHSEAFGQSVLGYLCLSGGSPLSMSQSLPIAGLRHYQQALEMVRTLGDRREEFLALIDLGNAYGILGDLQESALRLLQCLSLAQDLGDQFFEAQSLLNLASTFLHDENGKLAWLADMELPMGPSPSYRELVVRQAMRYCEKALRIVSAIDKPTVDTRKVESGLLANLGRCHNTLGQMLGEAVHYEHQVSCMERAQQLSQEIGDVVCRAGDLFDLAAVLGMLGKEDLAVSHLREAVALFHGLGRREEEGLARDLLEELRQRRGPFEEAQAGFQEALEVTEQGLAADREASNRRGEVKHLILLGGACYILGQHRKAIEQFERALAVITEIFGERHKLASSVKGWLQMAHSKATAEDPRDNPTISGFLQSTKSYELQAKAAGKPEIQVLNLVSEGRIFAQFGFFPKAIACFDLALTIATKESGLLRPRIDVLGNLAAACHNLGLYPRALKYYEEVAALLIPLATDDQMNSVRKNVAQTEEILKCYEEALGVLPADFDLLYGALSCYMQGQRSLMSVHDAGMACLRQRSFLGAAIQFTWVLNTARQIGEQAAETDALNKLARAQWSACQPGAAIDTLKELLQVAQSRNLKFKEADAWGNLGMVHGSTGEYRTAAECHRQALEIFESLLGPDHPLTEQERNSLEAARSKSKSE
jgi:tetratricopeptide (TPR) repeat protein